MILQQTENRIRYYVTISVQKTCACALSCSLLFTCFGSTSVPGRNGGAAGSSAVSRPQGLILSSGYFCILCIVSVYVSEICLCLYRVPQALNGLATLNYP